MIVAERQRAQFRESKDPVAEGIRERMGVKSRELGVAAAGAHCSFESTTRPKMRARDGTRIETRNLIVP